VILAAKLTGGVEYGLSPAPSAVTGCFAIKGPSAAWVITLTSCIAETVALSMTLYLVLRYGGRRHSVVLQMMFQDGLIYFVYMIVSGVIMIVFLKTFSDALSVMAGGFQRTLTSLLATRIILHLRTVRASLSRLGSQIPVGTNLEWAVRDRDVDEIIHNVSLEDPHNVD